jgi:hypothetical protein
MRLSRLRHNLARADRHDDRHDDGAGMFRRYTTAMN